MGPLQAKLRKFVADRYPMMLRGLDEARAIAVELVDLNLEECLQWAVNSHGEKVIVDIVEGYAFFTLDVNRAQIEYEKRGSYKFSSFADANALIYQRDDYMENYYWGIFAILFCWSHYVELMEFYLNRFVKKLTPGRLLEIAPGHGAWGLLALKYNSEIILEAWDISPTSLKIAPRLAEGAGLSKRASYKLGDATLVENSEDLYDYAICSFMLEHLEDPGFFLKKMSFALKSGAVAYVSLALTAAQSDHIFEFKQESEGIILAESAGFELIESRVAFPARIRPDAKFKPRVQAMLLQKK